MDTILCFAASLREDSLNKKLARAAAVSAGRQGAHATFADLRDYAMPIYDGDLETRDGVPEAAARFARLVLEHDALLIATPEYNGGPPALLKNTLDWVTRLGRAEGEPSGKTVLAMRPTLLVSASPGAVGGLRGSVITRAMLAHLGLWLLPQTVAVGGAQQAFDAEGGLADPERASQLDTAVGALLGAVRRA
jgi:NAD(P)H-dependent FMN reductase